jgi:hypothetical protein
MKVNFMPVRENRRETDDHQGGGDLRTASCGEEIVAMMIAAVQWTRGLALLAVKVSRLAYRR